MIKNREVRFIKQENPILVNLQLSPTKKVKTVTGKPVKGSAFTG